MKRNLFFVAALAALCLTSCLRDEDKDLLRNPIHVSGSVSPTLGVPVGYGEVTLNTLLGMLDSNFTGILDPNAEVLTIEYTFDTAGSIEGSNVETKHRRFRPRTKDADTLSYKDTVFEFKQDVNIFSNLPVDLTAIDSLEFDSVRLHLDLWFKGENFGIDSTISSSVKITIDSLLIEYVDNNNNPHTYDDLKNLRLIDNVAILEGRRIDTTFNVAEIVSALPKELKVKVRMRLAILSSLVAGDVTQLGFDDLLDSIQLARINYTAEVGVHFPFKLKIGLLPYTYVLSLGEQGLKSMKLDSIIDALKEKYKADLKLDLEDASLNMSFKNNIPFNLMLHADVLDADSNVLIPDVFNDEIKGSLLKWSPEYGAYISDGPDPSQLPLRFGIEDTATLNKLPDAAMIRLNVGIATSNRRHVAVRKSDYMGIRAYVKLGLNANMDMTLTEKPLPIPLINK